MPGGAARNGGVCALWDLDAKRAGKRAGELAGVTMPPSLVTAYTLSLDTPEAMAEAARAAGSRPLLKLNLDGTSAVDRVGPVRAVAPDAALIVDANSACPATQLQRLSGLIADFSAAPHGSPLLPEHTT